MICLRVIFLGLMLLTVVLTGRAMAQSVSLQALKVFGNRQIIGNGDVTPSLLDSTSFGVVLAGGTSVTRVFFCEQ
jgi:hypothetical protein